MINTTMNREQTAERYGDMAAMMMFGRAPGASYNLRPVGGNGREAVTMRLVRGDLVAVRS